MAIAVSDLTPQPTRPVETKYRRIRTPIPVPASLEEIRRLRAVEPQSMAGMPPVLWHQAQGFLVRDPYGNQWIDLTSGIIVANAGHAHPRIVAAVRQQLEAPLLFSYAYPTVVRRRFLERLVRLAPSGLNKAIAFSSGTEASECAISLMRKHGLRAAPDKRVILSFESCYHGRTLAARLAGGEPGPVEGMRREQLFHVQLPLPGSEDSKGFRADLDACGVDPRTVAGVLFESIPGWTTTPYPQPYLDELAAWAEKHDALLAADEIQCGMGRTGRWFAFEHYGIVPDLVVCGKGLSSSLPVSAVLGRGDVLDLAAPGEMSSTFGGNPLCLAAALANLDVLEDENLVARSAALGEDLAEALQRIVNRHRPHVRQCNGRGLFYSLHLTDPRTGKAWIELCDEIALTCVRRGVMLFVTGRGFLKFVPPLTIERDALLEALEVIGTAVDDGLNDRA
jgi:4-aminobutyrate aminotransferase-like enzyme